MQTSRHKKSGQVADKGLFGYEPPPNQRTPHRDVLKWVQGLDLSHSLKNVRRDAANGFMVAEILSRYFPQEVQMHSFTNATCTYYKKDNWEQIRKILLRQDLDLPEDLVLGTLKEEYGAGVDLLESLYEALNEKKLPQPDELPENGQDFVPHEDLDFGGMATSTDTDGQGRLGGARVSKDLGGNQGVEFGDISIKAVNDAASLRQAFNR